MEFLEDFFIYDPLTIAGLGSAVVAIFAVIFLFYNFQNERVKTGSFAALVIVVLAVTLYLSAETVYRNIASETGGPVHWHADFEIYICGKKVNLIEPTGFSNRVGTPLLHEHNDFRIHVEGVLGEKGDASLANFFEMIGGGLSPGMLKVPTDKGEIFMRDGDFCNNSNTTGTLQIFLWETINGLAKQRKIADYPNYIIKPEALIPPGDCIIIEFVPEVKGKTEHICAQYKEAELRGDIFIEN